MGKNRSPVFGELQKLIHSAFSKYLAPTLSQTHSRHWMWQQKGQVWLSWSSHSSGASRQYKHKQVSQKDNFRFEVP